MNVAMMACRQGSVMFCSAPKTSAGYSIHPRKHRPDTVTAKTCGTKRHHTRGRRAHGGRTGLSREGIELKLRRSTFYGLSSSCSFSETERDAPNSLGKSEPPKTAACFCGKRWSERNKVQQTNKMFRPPSPPKKSSPEIFQRRREDRAIYRGSRQAAESF